MRLLLTMMLSSNILFLMFLLINHFLGDCFSARQKSGLLKFSLVLSLIPAAYIKPLMWAVYKRLFHIPRPLMIRLNGHQQILYGSSVSFDMNLSLQIEVLIFTIWFLIGMAIFSYRLFRYLRIRKTLTQSLQSVSDPSVLEVFSRLTDEFHIKRAITLYTGGSGFSPFTMGIYRPVIVLPDAIEENELEFVLRHELCHIKHFDNLFTFIRLLTTGLYWFNPLFFMLD